MIESVLKSRLTNFPRLSNRDNIRLYELSDILSEILCVKNQDEYSSLLAYFDSSAGVKPVFEKLPYSLHEKWTTRAARYKTQHKTSFPPFSCFVNFVAEMSRVKNDPSFIYTNNSSSTIETRNTKTKVVARKTEVSSQYKEIDSPTAFNCAIHGKSHRVSKCREFISKSLEARKVLLRQKGLCFKCCDFQHTSRNCREIIKCQDCGNNRHVTAMHGDVPTKSHDGEIQIKSTNFTSKQHSTTIINSSCTEVCKYSYYGNSCAKILPVFVYPKGQREMSTKLYVMLDDQSNRSLARSAFFDLFKVNSRSEEYIMSSCSGKMTTSGRRAFEFVVESCRGELSLELPTLIECDNLSDNRHEIPTSDVAKSRSSYFLRFSWHRENDFKNELVEYRMKVQVFGNRPSPAVAIYGLHRTALVDKETFGSDIKKFVLNHFYLDDELISVHTVDEAIYILKRTHMALLVHGNLRLHKFASSSKEVMTEFPSDDLTKDL